MGAWLLHPDNTPSSFSELTARYGVQQEAAPPKGGEPPSVVRADLALLGPLMMAVYRKLQVSSSNGRSQLAHVLSLQEKELLSVFLEIESKLVPILAGKLPPTHTK